MLPLLAFAACATSGSLVEPGATALRPPETTKKPVKDVYHSVEITDDYRWLEDWNDKAVQAWSEAQNVFARSHLDRSPQRPAIEADVRAVLAAEVTSYFEIEERGGQIFAMKRQPPKQQPFLVVMPAIDKPEAARVLVDPNVLDAKGTTAIDWFRASPDGKLLAVSLSSGGSESGDVHFYDVATAKPTGEIIPRVNGGTAGGDLAWAADSSGVFYTRYPRGTERPAEDMSFFQQLYFHPLGKPGDQDRYELGKDLPRVAEISLEAHPSGRLIAAVQKGDGGEFSHFLREKDGKWSQLDQFEDKIVQIFFGPKDDLLILSREGAPKGKLLHVAIGKPIASATVLVPEGKDTIVPSFWSPRTSAVTADTIYVTYQLGGPSELRAFDLKGQPAKVPQQLPVSTVRSPAILSSGMLLFANASFTEPNGWFLYDPKAGTTTKTPLSTQSPVDLSMVEVVREMATSKDGTQVPVNILLPKKDLVRDGSHPCMVNGYGGYGVNIEPNFQAATSVLLKRGVVVAIANLRGGGEFGEEWHLQGNLTKKQNVFDDFAAVIKHMIEAKYTRSERIAIVGGSNGGLLMGATMTQHPELVRAVVSFVGIYDMLRVELSPNGAFNVPEFGTVKDPEQFKALHAYSPYHRVTDGTRYPATLFLTGQNDPRVDPMQSRKMTARLQAAQGGDAPILLRTSGSSGHGLDTSLDDRIAELSDAYSFLVDQLGVQ